ncbi:TX1 uncharacterized 149 kDa [Octopus vulgaris]|uniref:TX1 uncharacterized 149 kDa n=1 Tax=Octopus vulgaris TaxID=6645 RepID=A0AA36B3X4_OCTVU|nr:TX1 uncharacterized 149 kDa [Octopus vulgaris]
MCGLLTKIPQLAQSRLWKMKQNWWKLKAQALQDAADKCHFKSFYQNLKGVFGPISKRASPIFLSDGTLLTDKKEITKCWAEHFSNVLNRESTVDQEVIDNIPQKPTIENLADSPPMSEVEKAIKQLPNVVKIADATPEKSCEVEKESTGRKHPRSNLTRHKYTHTGEKPCQCDICVMLEHRL